MTYRPTYLPTDCPTDKPIEGQKNLGPAMILFGFNAGQWLQRGGGPLGHKVNFLPSIVHSIELGGTYVSGHFRPFRSHSIFSPLRPSLKHETLQTP